MNGIFKFSVVLEPNDSQCLEFLENGICTHILGFFNVLETLKKYKIKRFIYASTSSIYGLQKKFPLKEKFNLCN